MLRVTPEFYTMGGFIEWVARVIANTCQEDGSMLLREFQETCALVSTRGEPHGVERALAELGYTIDGYTIVGLRPRKLSDYPLGVSLETTRSPMARRYLASLLRECDE